MPNNYYEPKKVVEVENDVDVFEITLERVMPPRFVNATTPKEIVFRTDDKELALRFKFQRHLRLWFYSEK